MAENTDDTYRAFSHPCGDFSLDTFNSYCSRVVTLAAGPP